MSIVSNPVPASAIRRASHNEAIQMANKEIQKFVGLLESLNPPEWGAPTCCELWNVRQIVAHQLGNCALFSGFAELRHQTGRARLAPYRARGMSTLDSLNQLQVDEREHLATAELIASFREVGPRSVRGRARIPWVLRALPIPIKELGGIVRLGYLTDVIFTRDMWIHRLDICQATGREMALDPVHDGRMVALMVRDLAKKGLEQPVSYRLKGKAGEFYRIGKGTSLATLTMDALDFVLIATNRLKADDAIAKGLVEFTGHPATAAAALYKTAIPF